MQNTSGWGYIFNDFHSNYLAALIGIVRQIRHHVGASRVFVGGYSIGGFGAFQLGSYAPDLFDTVVSVAGYGPGTLEPENVPQPQSTLIFNKYLRDHMPRLAEVHLVVAVHAQKDTMSFYKDVSARRNNK